jgi:2-polyprenyl-6-methoxyphenol hydroxylase-like FAD-dependent oxidoreductase
MPMLEKAMGFPFLMHNREEFCQLLWENLAEKERIKTGKRVVSLEQGSKSAKVVFEDGTTEVGDVVIACDGIYSTIRQAVNSGDELAPISSASNKDTNGEILPTQKRNGC